MTSSGEAMVKVDGLRKSYGTVEAVRGVSLEVHRGQVVVVIGPSGCGKSTFLRCINLLEEPSAGTLQVGDRRIDFGSRSGRGEHSMPHGRELFHQDFDVPAKSRPGVTFMDVSGHSPHLLR